MYTPDPQVMPVSFSCPRCGELQNEAVVTPFKQLLGASVMVLREAFDLHVVALVSVQPRRLLVVCGSARPQALDASARLGQREVAAAAHVVAATPKGSGGPAGGAPARAKASSP